ncbi:MAG: xanthine dehydrogenase family protein subunit M [bacterium]|nr:xanthine dehydrogenase family protein subunit M [bacterium]
MSVRVAESLEEVCNLLAANPSASLLAGGTDFMVEVNYSQRRPTSVIAIDRVPELTGWRRHNGAVEMGAALTYSEMEHPLFAAYVPALAQAARTVGSPQIRNAGTLGGNLATASPAGDTLPPLAALDARITVCSVRGTRQLGLDELIVGPKQNTLAPDEVIRSVTVPVIDGPQEFLKVGTRNAMVISVATVALVLDRDRRNVRVALGSVSPVPVRATEAEEWIAGVVDWGSPEAPPDDVLGRFGELVAAVSSPIDDHRSTADYRRHAVAVMARRALARVLS